MRFQHLFIQRYGRTLQHTVAIDVGTDDFTNTFPDIIFQKREQFASTLILPTVDGHLMVFHISSENYSLRAVCLQPVTETFGILYGNTTARHHLCTAFKCNDQIFIALHPATEIYNQRSTGSYLLQRAVIYHMVGNGSVEVYHMKASDTMRFKFLSYFYRVLIIHFLAVIITLGEAYALSVDDVNSGN